MPSFPIVDSHVHLYDIDRLRYGWLDGVPKLKRTYVLDDFDRARATVNSFDSELLRRPFESREFQQAANRGRRRTIAVFELRQSFRRGFGRIGIGDALICSQALMFV